MAVGWSRDGAVQEQIDATVADAVDLARQRISIMSLFLKKKN